MDTTRLEIEALEGIGTVAGSALRGADIEYVCDLLFVPLAFSQQAVAGISSAREVERWRSMANLLLADGMNPQWAEALTHAGIDDLEDLIAREFDELTALFADAHAEGRIPEVPDTAELFQMVRSATAVRYGTTLKGRAVDVDDTPVADADVFVGSERTTTNSAGHWMVVAVQADHGHRVTVVADGFEDFTDPDPHATTDDWASVVPTSVLARGESVAEPIDEYDGDEIPEFRSYRTVQEVNGEDDLRDGDCFVISHLYVNGDVKLSSVLRAYVRGDLVFRSYRVPRDLLPEAIEQGECLSWNQGAFRSHGIESFLPARLRAMHIRRMQREALTQHLDGLSPFERFAEGERLLREQES